MLTFFLKVNLYGLLFAGSYWLLLRRHTFFGLNRAYLLAATVLSLMLPLTRLPSQTVEALPGMDVPGLDWPGMDLSTLDPANTTALPMIVVDPTPIDPIPTTSQPDWEKLGLTAYSLISLLLLARLILRIGRLLRLIRRSPQRLHENYVLVQPNNRTIPTFSFFRYIMLHPADAHNDQIIQHELVHVRQYHSADVIWMSFVRAVFWACPVFWFIDHQLRQVHEFLADKPARQSTEYARFLVEYSLGLRSAQSEPDTLANSFFTVSLLKQRIMMLHQKATNRWAMGKYALVFPLVFGLLAMTTTRDKIKTIVNQEMDRTITVSGRVTDAGGKFLSGAHVVVANTGKGVPADPNGFYTLSDVPVSATLAFSHIGYRSDRLILQAFDQRIKNNRLQLNPRLMPNLQDELPAMGATAVYKAIKPNPAMPIRTPPSSETINGRVLTAVEETAVFPTGIPGLMQYVAHHLQYPAKARTAGIQGDVYVIFTVLPTGAIGDVQVNKRIKRIGGGCEEEAVRVVTQMPRWIPAHQNNTPVAVRYQIPIRFALEKTADNRTGKRLTAQPDSAKKFSAIIDNSKNSRFGLYNDYQPASYSLPDSLRQRLTRKLWLRSSGNKPLLVINGVEASMADQIKLKPADIESVTVLKNSATLAYGPRGIHGVLLITTKNK